MLKGHFIPARSGALFITQFGEFTDNSAVLLLPSIFEEMNLSRAVIAKQAQFLANSNRAVFVMDYYGTGDSEGEIDNADAQIWCQDIVDAVQWLHEKGVTKLTLWGHRFGALLGLNCIDEIQNVMKVESILLWKPVTKGKMFVTQFLRLKQANAMMQGGDKKDWRQEILSGEEVEVAGYPITKKLLSSLDDLVFPTNNETLPRVYWVELASASITPAVSNALKGWSPEGYVTLAQDGTAFWQIPEVFEQHQLHQTTLALLEGKA